MHVIVTNFALLSLYVFKELTDQLVGITSIFATCDLSSLPFWTFSTCLPVVAANEGVYM